MKFDGSNKFDLAMLLWASKFATVKIECCFEMGKLTPLEVLFILLLMVPTYGLIICLNIAIGSNFITECCS